MSITHETLSGGILRLRVTSSQMHRLRAAAATECQPLADYVRGLLDQNLYIRDELASLRRIILEQVGQSNQISPAVPIDGAIDSAAIETLLLLRQLVRPENLRVAHADLTRLGLTPFQSIGPTA